MVPEIGAVNAISDVICDGERSEFTFCGDNPSNKSLCFAVARSDSAVLPFDGGLLELAAADGIDLCNLNGTVIALFSFDNFGL